MPSCLLILLSLNSSVNKLSDLLRRFVRLGEYKLSGSFLCLSLCGSRFNASLPRWPVVSLLARYPLARSLASAFPFYLVLHLRSRSQACCGAVECFHACFFLFLLFCLWSTNSDLAPFSFPTYYSLLTVRTLRLAPLGDAVPLQFTALQF